MSRKQQVESSVAAAPAQPARRDFFRRGGTISRERHLEED